ncbi:MAG: tetratricopeptide repeat protein [Verrucomicrobiota bacterium]|jgi:tetratricopeptide (TPR) repeat protein
MKNSHASFSVRAVLRRWCLLFFCGGLLLPGALHATKSAEDKALSTARALFDDRQYNLAETNLASFVATYTNSTHRPYAILYLARSQMEQSNYDGAIKLLTSAAPRSGDLAGEYTFWTARARLDKGEYAQAEEGFGGFIKDFTNAPRRLEAACDEAEALSKLENWPRVIDFLQKPDGVFRKLSAVDPKNSFVTRGLLLLGEALSALGRYAEGENVVGGIDPAGLAPEWQWQRQDLLCRLELAGSQADLALQNSVTLLETASGPRHQAASRFLRGEILQTLGRMAEALQCYTNNLTGDVSPGDQRQALTNAVALILARGQIEDAAQLLENYVAQPTNGAALDLARVSLGELYLKIYYNTAPPQAIYLQTALTNFESVIRNLPASPLVAQAHLDRGWCYWAETNLISAKADFQEAANLLPFSPEQAVARFKLADAEFSTSNYSAALADYNLLLQQYANVESVTNGLFDQALYKIVQANLAVGDSAGAEAASWKILDWFPNSLFGDRAQLLIGESKKYDYDMARQVFNKLLERSPKTPLRPEVEYAIARTYEQQGNWPEALREYDHWVSHYDSNSPLLLPRVEYARALVYGKAGMETNALALFTNFVARFTNSPLAAWAQNWVADYYFNQGDSQLAEENYQLLYQKKFSDAGELPYEARLMAGRAALAGQRPVEAAQYFRDLVNIANAPTNLVAQGYFALGDTFLQQFLDNPTNGTFLNEAITAISHLTNGAPTNALAAQAYGRLGDCYMQWADKQWELEHDPKVYTEAVQMYQTLLSLPATNVDVTAWSQAEVALGRVAEQQDQPRQALAHYANVLDDLDPDHFDPFWVEQAGKAAARIYEQQQQWDTAIKVYRRVLRAVPSLRPALEKAIAAAQRDADKARN